MQTKDTHVLVLAMSDLSGLNVNYYQYKPENGTESEVIEGIGQLEVIPQFIDKYIKEKITHIVILETKLTQKRLTEDFIESVKKANSSSDQPIIRFESQDDEMKFYDEVCAVSFFKRRMKEFGITPAYVDVDFDEDNPEQGFKELLDAVRELYRECQENNGDWKLWMDSHGGFRDVSMALDTLLQVLSLTDMTGYPKLMDGQKIIGVNGVYSVKFTKNSTKENPCPIVDRTDFYSKFTTSALRTYMNYGQYLQTMLSPYEGNLEYAFISYKHGEAEKERLTFLSLMKKEDYRYWYDDGIRVQEDWEKKLEEKKCSDKNILFIALISEGYFSSPQCLKELKDAIRLEKKIILVSLDHSPLYLNHDLIAERDGLRVEIPSEELNSLSKPQHIDLHTYIKNDVLQERRLLDQLNEAACVEMERIRKPEEVQPSDADKEQISGCFVNFSNHPTEKWDIRQKEAAEAFGPVVYVPFPDVDPEQDDDEIVRLANQMTDEILSYHPKAVMCQGESTLCIAVVRQLQLNGIEVYAACSKRDAKEYSDDQGNTIKKTVFRFVQFRKYPNI